MLYLLDYFFSANKGENAVWVHSGTLLLIDQYKAWEPKIKKKKNLWAKISEIMQLHGYSYNSEQCEGKWKTLVRSLKKVADHNSKSGNELKIHPYEDELSFFSAQPNVKPSYIVGSTIDGAVQNVGESDPTGESDTDNGRSPSPAPVPAKKKRSNVSEVLDVLKEHMLTQSARQAEALQRQEMMHQERMSVMKGFLDVFRDMRK